MAFYDLSKAQRALEVAKISALVVNELSFGGTQTILSYFADDDTYIRKAAYLAVGKIYYSQTGLQQKIIDTLDKFTTHENYKVRQCVINAAGEIGKKDFAVVQKFFDAGLYDNHHSPRNAVIGSIKKMGEVNPHPVLNWAKKNIHHEDREIRREICHGIELRGRKYPQDILPLLKELQFDKAARVRNTLVHVIGQISYKKDCLKTVIDHLKTWENKQVVANALEEIIDVHHRYKNFSAMTQEQAANYISTYYP